MRLRVELGGRLEADDDIAAVSRVVCGVEDSWHDWIAPDPGDPDLETYYQQNPTHRELLAKSYTAAVAYGRPSVRTVTVTIRGTTNESEDSWALQDAVAYLAQPLEVLVENERSDGRFFTACWTAVVPRVADKFGGRRPAAVFGQGGGKAEVLNLVQHRMRTQSASGTPPRMFVLLDSDATCPGHVTKESKALLENCSELGVPIALLNKRTIENYVADRQLRKYAAEFPEVEPSVTFLISLTAAQRDSYPVKKGIDVQAGSPVGLSDGEKQLYAGVTWLPAGRAKLPRLMEYVLEDEVPVTRDDLDDRDGAHEMLALAERLEEEI